MQDRTGTEVVTAAGPLTCPLFTWVPGRTLRTRLTIPRAADLGGLSAQLHEDAASWRTSAFPRSCALVPIDVQDLTWGFEVEDLAITIGSLRRFPAAGRLVEAFTTGYVSRRPWPVPSPELLEAVVVARTLNQVDLVLNVHGTAGREQQLAERAAAVRAWLDAPGGSLAG